MESKNMAMTAAPDAPVNLRELLEKRAEKFADKTFLFSEADGRSLSYQEFDAAVTSFANPVMVLGPMAVGAIQLRMLAEMAVIYDAQLSAEFVEFVGRQMANTLLKLGLAEATASVIAGFFKFNPLGFAAGGLIQSVTMAYLTRLTGASFQEYLERGQSWGEGGMQVMLSRQLEESRRSAWLMQFAKMALRRFSRS